MDYMVYKLEFQGAVHFGGRNMEEGEYACCADTIFSALCQEAVKMSEDALQSLYRYAKEGQFLLSDAFPYIGDTLFVPKPMRRVEISDHRGDSVIKKAYKKLKYVPMDKLETYLSGKYDVLSETGIDGLGNFEMKTSARVRGGDETLPYRIGTYYFEPGNGLYVIVGYGGRKVQELADQLWKGLSHSGIGGRRASGMGRFILHPGQIAPGFRKRLQGEGAQYMSLSVSLPREEELEEALEGASYLLNRRSGFVASDRYAPEQMRKRDLYVLAAGSCFSNRFEGDVYDVSGGWGNHPVYRYARPIFVEVDV